VEFGRNILNALVSFGKRQRGTIMAELGLSEIQKELRTKAAWLRGDQRGYKVKEIYRTVEGILSYQFIAELRTYEDFQEARYASSDYNPITDPIGYTVAREVEQAVTPESIEDSILEEAGAEKPIRYEATGSQVSSKMEQIANALEENTLVKSNEKIVFDPGTVKGPEISMGEEIVVTFSGRVASREPIQAAAPSQAAQAQQAPQPAQAPQTYPCPYCRQALTWVAQYQRWYCNRCQQYR
jgi:hypothetical protein